MYTVDSWLCTRKISLDDPSPYKLCTFKTKTTKTWLCKKEKRWKESSGLGGNNNHTGALNKALVWFMCESNVHEGIITHDFPADQFLGMGGRTLVCIHAFGKLRSLLSSHCVQRSSQVSFLLLGSLTHVWFCFALRHGQHNSSLRAFLCKAAYLAAFRCFKAPKEEPFWWEGWRKIHLKRWRRGKSLGQVREVRKPAHPLNQRQEPSNRQPVWSKTIDPNAVSPSQFSILEPTAGLSAHPGLNSSSHTLPLPFIAFFPSDVADWKTLPAMALM